jgi:hypothetical protein
MYFGYDHVGDGRTTKATGGTDVLEQVGSAAKSDYSFAEGYTNLGYDEWLTIQNPTASTETVDMTVSNGVGTIYTFARRRWWDTAATRWIWWRLCNSMCSMGATGTRVMRLRWRCNRATGRLWWSSPCTGMPLAPRVAVMTLAMLVAKKPV